MGIKTTKEYVKFYINLDMKDSVSLLSFANNEKMILKQKLENKRIEKIPIVHGIKILEELIADIKKNGEHEVLKKYIE
ncbi:hypothetical protein [Candidatus Nitrosarchaeum limnium]|uniref:Uncharacterized protein n=1 Tax=Candidatus Nitrosarchaeum limnium BG20 TaxID=859192 RepID=S2E1L1_9ARCH|nr:hypothetical protein [Candidatus Nitrosarchaeum limnium]EPA05200.1 hypothetical protein BG20_I2242 [Candidatus Nitrosarchaeum limnium BG20]